MRRFLLVAILAAGLGWYWTHWRPAHNYKPLTGQLQSALNKELAEAGVRDKDVRKTFRQERWRWGVTWVENDREIQLAPARWPRLLDRLSAQAKRLGCTVMRRSESPEKGLLEIGKGPFLLQRLTFVPAPVASLPTNPEVALVIDDVAYDLNLMDGYAALGIPLTFAILPRDRHSKALSEKAVSLQFPVILHLPLEPQDMIHNNPGGAALYLAMTPKQLRDQFEKDVTSVPHIQGINNHMGSAFTEDMEKMQLLLGWVKEKDLFFLDSHTSLRSIAAKAAKRAGVPCLVNETFLDNQDDAKAIEHQLDLVLKLALKRKRTIAIGHYRRKYLMEALANKIPEFRARGITFVGLPHFYTGLQS